MAIEQHARSCPRLSSSPRNCARRGQHPCGRAGGIAETHSGRAPKGMPRKRKLQQMRVHDFLNARTGSLACELATAPSVTQEISAGSARLGDVKLIFVNSKIKLIAKDQGTVQPRRNYKNKKLPPAFPSALLVLKIRHFISNHSAHALLAITGLCRDSICDFSGITSTVGRTRLGTTASSWDQLKPWRR